jgi:hypothetical protein
LIPHLTDAEIERLAEAWTNCSALAVARDTALSARTPLIHEVLGVFESVDFLFHECCDDTPTKTVDDATKAIRDAVAAAFARPLLRRAQYRALMRPWRLVQQRPTARPLYGPQTGHITRLLDLISTVGNRCHDGAAERLFDELDNTALILNRELADHARAAVSAAVEITGRARLARFIEAGARRRASGGCQRCGETVGTSVCRVRMLCSDAAVALTVSDLLDDTLVEVLTVPVTSALARAASARIGSVGNPDGERGLDGSRAARRPRGREQ